jgi:hypothetical protein
MRISKDWANDVARSLCQKSRDHVSDLKVAFRELATTIYESQVPKEVIKLGNDHPTWVNKITVIIIDGAGFNRYNCTATRLVYAKPFNQAHITMSNPIGDRLTKARRAYEDAENVYKLLVQDTLNALLNLGTTKRISEQFPEAAKYIAGPKQVYPVPTIPLDPLRKRLASQKLMKISNLEIMRD